MTTTPQEDEQPLLLKGGRLVDPAQRIDGACDLLVR